MNLKNRIDKSRFLSAALNLLGRRIVPYVCGSYDSDKLIQWQFNACRQTAMVVDGFLKKQTIFKVEDCEVFESEMKDILFGNFDHAWNRYVNTETGHRIYVDVGTVTYSPLDLAYPKDTDFSIGMIRETQMGGVLTHISDTKLDAEVLNAETEFYTGLPGQEFVDLCLSYIQKYHKNIFS